MNKIIELAEREIGYKRRPATPQEVESYAKKNKMTAEAARKLNLQWNKFGDWFGFNYVPYCAMFCSKMMHDAGVPIRGDWPKGWASVPNMLKHYTATNEITHYPQAGDLVIFDWQRDGKPDHVGFFIKDLGNGTFETIEGNTSDGNPSNGGCVERKTRKYTQVEAFIHPKIFDTLT
jgi:cell wall-associated NlpC family hydrolase